MNLHRRELAQKFLRNLTLLTDLGGKPGVSVRVEQGVAVSDLADQVPNHWDLGDPGALWGQGVVQGGVGLGVVVRAVYH